MRRLVFGEFGGKILQDHHAARVLPGYDPDVKIKLLQRLQDACSSMPAGDRLSVTELFEEVGLGRLLGIRTRRRVERANHREVLGAPAA